MTPPLREVERERETSTREAKHPLRRPESAPAPSRTESIVQAILTWLDGQL
ncbi:MAG TPA: hypothetical protein VLQ79_08940 [Myxococcaceae bacterium]|nr:hypothetical protein [Myxococcaceae bacterium]